jgi:hypothetical protein
MIRLAGGVLIASLLAGCAGAPSGATAPTAAAVDMSGRWILAAPNTPTCGMNFAGAPGANEGTISPEGGCPGNFFTSRHWTLAQGALTINDEENQPLASLTITGAGFEGQATSGMALTLSR